MKSNDYGDFQKSRETKVVTACVYYLELAHYCLNNYNIVYHIDTRMFGQVTRKAHKLWD